MKIKSAIKGKLIYILIFIICLQFLIIYSLEKRNIRCSSFFSTFLDDILGLDVGQYECNYAPPHKVEFPYEYRYQKVIHKTKVRCPTDSDVIVLIGQSNSANSVLSNKYSESKNLNFFENNCYLLSDPVLGATGALNSIAPSLSYKLKNKKPVIFLTNGWGGTSISKWSNKKSILTEYVRTNIKQLIFFPPSIRSRSPHPSLKNNLKFIIWLQGESDNGTSDYVEHFKQFRKNLFKNFNSKSIDSVKFIITQTSICEKERDKNLNKQQKSLTKIFNDIIITNVTDNLDMNYRIGLDNCHFNPLGVEKITDEIAIIINEHIY